LLNKRRPLKKPKKPSLAAVQGCGKEARSHSTCRRLSSGGGSIIGTNTVPVAPIERPNWNTAIIGDKTDELLGDVLGLIVLAQQPDVVVHYLARGAAAREGKSGQRE
jgi:hypothetical protein